MQNTQTRFDKQHLELWKNSGLSKADYCRQQGISYQQFLYHFKQLKRKASGGFVELPLHTHTRNTSPIEFHLANGNYFVFPAGTDMQSIAALVSKC